MRPQTEKTKAPRLGLVCITHSDEVRYRTVTRKRLLQFPEAEQKRMLEKVKPVYDKNVPNIGAEAVGVVTDALKKARGG